jgi:hypothetical protein
MAPRCGNSIGFGAIDSGIVSRPGLAFTGDEIAIAWRAERSSVQ